MARVQDKKQRIKNDGKYQHAYFFHELHLSKQIWNNKKEMITLKCIKIQKNTHFNTSSSKYSAFAEASLWTHTSKYDSVQCGPCLAWHVALVDITWKTTLMFYRQIKSLQLIWKSGTGRWSVRLSDVQIKCNALTKVVESRGSSHSTKQHAVLGWHSDNKACHSGGRLNKKDGLTRYGDSHVKDKTS